MAPSKIANKYPTYRDESLKSCVRWLEGKRIDDNAEGLWRIHDKLYDFTDFVRRHPGGAEWLEVTRGVDITEQFETHHITGLAEKLLPKFYIREASQPRNYKITFDENGFYKTLKRRVAEKLDFLDHSVVSTSRFYCDLTLTSLFLLSIIAARDNSLIIASFASLSLVWLAVIAHNFVHQRDNWRMYLINLALMNFREWRVFHVMSHHLYPNSYHDLEITLMEPFFNWMPVEKKKSQKILSWVCTPLYYTLIFGGKLFLRVYDIVVRKDEKHWDELICLLLPSLMFIVGSPNVFIVLKIWIFILAMASLLYGVVSINAGHHHTSIFHDGDDLRSLDFGLYQLSATVERVEANYSQFMTLTNFGYHTLHHLFPTLDHAILPQLTDTFLSTCKEFEGEMKEFPWYELIAGQFRQLLRTEPIKILS